MRDKETKEVLPVNRKVKDSLFKEVYASKERLGQLAEFLLGVQSDTIEIANVRPVLFGNKENDLSFFCNDAIYCMMEEQSSMCLNMPYRLLEYITAGLRGTVDAEQSLYGSARVYFPTPKLYMTRVGLEKTTGQLAQRVQYDMRLSESFRVCVNKRGERIEPDLEAVVHVLDFRMTMPEVLAYIEQETLPERLRAYADNDLLGYALSANCILYIQRVSKEEEYSAPANVTGVPEVFELLKSRGIFVDLFSDQEVCNMTAATFSRDDILRYQGMEQGLQRGMEQGLQRGMEQGLQRGIEQGLQRGMEQGTEQATIRAIQNMLELGLPEEKILQKYSQEELDRALAEITMKA